MHTPGAQVSKYIYTRMMSNEHPRDMRKRGLNVCGNLLSFV